MSMENVALFMEKASEDQALQKKLKELGEKKEDVVNGIINLGKTYGYAFSEEDMKKFSEETINSLQQEGELNDDQLEAVAGGKISREDKEDFAYGFMSGMTFGLCFII